MNALDPSREALFGDILVSADLDLSPAMWSGLAQLSRTTVRLQDRAAPAAANAGAEVFLASWTDKIDGPLLDRLPDVRVVALRATTTANVDVTEISARGITLINIDGYSDRATAEFVLYRLFFLARDCRQAQNREPVELRGRTLGLVGLGKVGSIVADMCSVIGMTVQYVRRSDQGSRHIRAGLESVLSTSDFISFHTPPNAEVLSAGACQLIPADTGVVITTRGVPCAAEVFAAWASWGAHDIVLDFVAARDVLEMVRGLPRVYVDEAPAARTMESRLEAERQLLTKISSAG